MIGHSKICREANNQPHQKREAIRKPQDVKQQVYTSAEEEGRRDRNIRDNLFIVYGIINFAIKEKLEIDLNLYDLANCFDSMWFHK